MGQALVKKRNSKSKFEIKDEYFIRNGGIFLGKQIALSRGKNIEPGRIKMFSIKDIERATNGFDPDLIVGSVRYNVYKATLEDRIVAIKTPMDGTPDLELLDFFLTEAAVGIVMSHHNKVKLYGCCLETCVPILVYEFLPKGGLFERLYAFLPKSTLATTTLGQKKSLGWSDRLRIATDVSYALSYMHNALPKQLVHRDIQSSNILLDESLHGKLSNFGFSVSITPGEKPQKWPVLGVPGYVDPEYIDTQEVTDKCDVYSFGVLMLELLTGRHPSTMAQHGIDLVDTFVTAVGRDCMMEMIDKDVLEKGCRNEIGNFAALALKCVAMKGIERPTMIEVVSELWRIQGRE